MQSGSEVSQVIENVAAFDPITNTTPHLVIDETPISPVRPAHVRQNSLEKHLQHRPDPQELKDRHILLDTNAAP